MKRQISELTFQLAAIKSARRAIRANVTRASKLDGDGPFPVQLSLCSAQRTARAALDMIKQAQALVEQALEVARQADLDGEASTASEPDVAACGVTGVQLMEAAQWMNAKATYHLKRFNHLTAPA